MTNEPDEPWSLENDDPSYKAMANLYRKRFKADPPADMDKVAMENVLVRNAEALLEGYVAARREFMHVGNPTWVLMEYALRPARDSRLLALCAALELARQLEEEAERITGTICREDP